MAEPATTRHFATITGGRWGARQVHYRRAGRGPVVLCLHQSPLSSLDMLATMARWRPHLTCIAPDTPGFGLSDPLGVPHAEMEDFADAVVEFMDALGVARAAVYGFHTGAMIALTLAARHPQRVSCAVANGVVLLTDEERDDFVRHYLPPLRPSWDGAHLAWLWARLREQRIFFPWYRAAAAARLPVDMPSPATLQDAALDFMRSGDHYRVGYRAAFTLRSAETLRHAATPLLATAAATDVLAQQLPRIRGASPQVTVQPGGTPDETLDLGRRFIKRQARERIGAPVAAAALRGVMRQDFITVPGGQLRLRRNDDGEGTPVLLLHDAFGSVDTLRGVAAGFIGRRPVMAIDLPGHGESDAATLRGRPSIAAHARTVLAALDALGLQRCEVMGMGSGATVALALALRAPTRIAQLTLVGLPMPDAAARRGFVRHGLPDIRAEWHGGHLLQAWHMLRDRRLYRPWFDRSRAGVLRATPRVDPDDIQTELLDLLRSGGMWRRTALAALTHPVASQLVRLAKLRVATRLAAAPADPYGPDTLRAARAFQSLPFVALPDDPADWAVTLSPPESLA
jgi:pimeloyl-ACP methyl ester carboxylesterase